MTWGVFGHAQDVQILDYGDAGRLTGLRLHCLGFREVTMADDDSMFADFLRFLCEKYRVPVTIVERAEAERDLGAYSYVICQRAVPEFGDPMAVLRRLRRAMTPSGLTTHPGGRAVMRGWNNTSPCWAPRCCVLALRCAVMSAPPGSRVW